MMWVSFYYEFLGLDKLSFVCLGISILWGNVLVFYSFMSLESIKMIYWYSFMNLMGIGCYLLFFFFLYVFSEVGNMVMLGDGFMGDVFEDLYYYMQFVYFNFSV